MAAQQNFRTAFNGFNREDVVRYIEYINAKHTAEINQLNSELEYLRSQQAAAAEEKPEVDPVVEEQAARIRELFDRCKALEEELAAAKSAQATQPAVPSRTEEELEAYRRAERTERMARERAEQLYRQANGALADATIKVDEAASQIGELTDRVMSHLSELQSAVTGSKQALKDAAATMYTIRPESDTQ